jgi:hypothetical protein
MNRGRPTTLVEVAELILSGHEATPLLRMFLDEFYNAQTRKEKRKMIVDEPALLPSEKQNAYLAATAEHLSFRYKLKIPEWCLKPERFLKMPWFPLELESLKALCIMESPTAFRRRMIFVDKNPLYRPRKDYPSIHL